MSKDIKEILQEDIDEICMFGCYSVSRAYTTLVAARQKIEQLEKEIEELEGKEEEIFKSFGIFCESINKQITK